MAVSVEQVFLYAAVESDYMKCFAIADVCGIPYSNVLGNYNSAWQKILNGQDMLIAVGGAALYALYYNPCGWSNPSGLGQGQTPFNVFPCGQGISTPAANLFVNAAGYTALDSLKLGVMLAYYAIHETFPTLFTGLPRQETPQQVCVTGSSSNLSLNTVMGTVQKSRGTATVGVYAAFQSATQVKNAITSGWGGIADTGGLGTISAPYTSELAGRPDYDVAEAIAETNGTAWWISFWTVSWPAVGDTFYQASYQAGQYVARLIDAYDVGFIPNYVVLDPEGYNTPATTVTDWHSFIQGWVDGVTSVDGKLVPAFYCNQSQYEDYQLSTLTTPAFIAISPISGNHPQVSGQNITGYITYYGNCPVSGDIAQIESWGGKYNTIQFRDNGVDCSP